MFYIHPTEKWIEDVVQRMNERQLKPEQSRFMIAFFSSLDNEFVEYFKSNKDRISSYSGQNFHLFTPLIYDGNVIPDDEWRYMRNEFKNLGIPVDSDPTFIFFDLEGGGVPKSNGWKTFSYHPRFFAGFTCNSFHNFPNKLKLVIDCCIETKHSYDLPSKLSEIFQSRSILRDGQVNHQFSQTIANKLPKSKLFISHSSIDKPFIRRLEAELSKDNELNFWLDEREILVGDDIQQTITKNLSDSDYLLLIISDNSTKSNWVNFEVSQFMGFADGKNIIPIILNKSTTFPEPIDNLLRRIKYLDFSDDTKWDKNIQELKRKFDNDKK